ncbi:hypothetical protein J6R97_02955 [bacterium]|nr:hypothetical protein [bacterium]
MVTIANIFSTLGNPNSLIPLAIKDTVSTAGMTAGSYITGKEEGHDRLIDEVGTEIIWLCGIPFFKWLYNKTVFKAFDLDSKFDARNLKDKSVLAKIKEYAQTDDIKNNIDKIIKKEKVFKNTATSRFFISTGLAVVSYIGLTKFKQNYTDNKIRKNLIEEYQNSQIKNLPKQDIEKSNIQPSFKGLGSVIESLAFSPVKNMWVLDGCITGERLKDSRTKQEFIGYAIKEASILFFMYYAGGKIQELLEYFAEKRHNISINLDARVLEGDFLKNAFNDKSIEKSLAEFKMANTSPADLYEFIHKNPDNLIVKTAKISEIIKMDKETGKIDVRKYIDLKEFEGVKDKIEKLYGQYKEALVKGKTSQEFFSKVKKLKRGSILTNIGSSILALGVLTPAIMLINRVASDDNQEFETKKRIREDLIKKGIIV